MNKTIGAFFRRAGGSLLFTGYFPFASGTVGSALAAAAVWALNARFPDWFSPAHYPAQWLVAVSATALSILAGVKTEQTFGSTDPSPFVLDEFAGQLVTFLMIPLTWRTLVLGFLLFRFFDIVKPYPVYVMEELEEGVGVTMDDVIAGVYANISLTAILFVYQLIKSAL